MKEKSTQQKTFIEKLFDNLVFKQLAQFGQEIHQIIKQKKQQSFIFYDQIQAQILSAKAQIKKICSNAPICNEKNVRKIINALMNLTKDLNFLLEEGILNLYMDLIQLKEQSFGQAEYAIQNKILTQIIQVISPLLYEFFSFRQYKKSQNQRRQIRKLNKCLSINKKMSSQSDENQNNAKNTPKIDSWINDQQIERIRSEFSEKTIKQLLDEYLNQYQIQLDQMKQTCKICQKKIKMTHLEEHVAYCQQKYIIKQDIKGMLSQISDLVRQLLQKIQNDDFLSESQESKLYLEYRQILQDIYKNHKSNTAKKETTKNIKSQMKIKQNMQRYDEIIYKLEYFLQKKTQENIIFDNVSNILGLQRKIQNLYLQLRDVEIQHQNLKQIGSESTIRPSSQASNCRSDKKSRFAQDKKSQKSSKNSQVVQFKDEQIKDSHIQSQNNLRQQSQNLCQLGLKTKQSLGNSKNVQFDIEEFQDQQSKATARSRSVRRKNKRVMSLVMFDKSSDEQDDQAQNNGDVSESTSKRGQSLNTKQFQILKFLGKGAFGKVYAVRRKNTEDLYALKMINMDQNCGQKQFQQIKNQHEIFKKVAGQHLVQAPFCFSEGGAHIFMMEFMPGGDLSKVLEQQVYLEQERARMVLAQIVLAIEHLHNAQIIHRDLKPENLVIDDRGHLKLTDFGLSEIKLQNKLQKVLNNKNQDDNKKARKKGRRRGIVACKQKAKLIGTPDYIAPQIINGVSINNKTIDWWSLGVIAYEIMIGVRPFCGNQIQEIMDNILRYNIEWPEIGTEDGMISQQAFDLISKLLNRDFIGRLGANGVEQIKFHPFFTGIDWENIKYQSASIQPNYAKVKELLQMPEDAQLRKQIEEKVGLTFSNINMPKLDNFVRFDILGQKTVKQANKLKVKKTGALRRLQSIKQFIIDKQNDHNEWLDIPRTELKKKTKSFAQFDKSDCDINEDFEKLQNQ